MLAALVVIVAVALVAGWEVFCLADLARADRVRFLPRWAWAVACLIQIPILIGAIIFVNSSMYKPLSAMALPIIVLLLVIWFLVIGNGKLSFLKFSEK